MKLKFNTPFNLFIALSLLLVACAKTGPTGPAGPAGPTGAAGAAGAAGAKGDPGTANVIYSPWLDVTFKGTDTTGWFADIDVPGLVDSILNQGEIKVYSNFGSDSAGSQFIVTLPVTSELYFTGVTIQPYFAPKKITLVSTGNLSTFTDSTGNKYLQYRYILIPGGTAAGRKARVVDWNKYADVQRYLGLKD